jgi:thymidylate synthase (FAD)
MKFKEPKAFMIAETGTIQSGIQHMLDELGAPEWVNNAETGATELIEVAGRICYKAFGTELNPNVTRVREDNHEYIGNVVEQGHGSVLEHACVTFAFLNVTRVFTHEIVRHRVGTAFSQESLRYVRLEDLAAYYPEAFADQEADDNNRLVDMFRNVFIMLENVQKRLAKLLKLDDLGKDEKIKLTSSMRRLAPIGLCTNIVVTANHRMWRHIIEMRCSPHAEEEIRTVMTDVARQLQRRFPAIYQDLAFYGLGEGKGMIHAKFKHRRV